MSDDYDDDLLTTEYEMVLPPDHWDSDTDPDIKPPKDNRGRSECWWCGKTTILIDLFREKTEYCPSCKK